MRNSTLLLFLTIIFGACGEHESWKMVYSDNFEKDLVQWVVEGDPNTVSVGNGQLEFDTPQGLTVWFKEELQQPIRIEYEATVLKGDGPNDRASDLNCFWLANDPANPDQFFTKSAFRNGIFRHYDTLQLYYVGLGGHNNTKTRFRRYEGSGEKPLLPQHDLSEEKFLIVPNKKVMVRIEVVDEKVTYQINGITFFDFEDSDPYSNGFFGFRTIQNHMVVDNFKIWQKD